MADDKHYVGGEFYRICDRTGFKIRAPRTRKEWTGAIVRSESWEPRHPQDFVKGVRDYQAVPDPRPRQTNRFVGPLETSITSFRAAGATSLPVVSSVRMSLGDILNVMMDNGVNFQSEVSALPDANTVVIQDPLPWSTSPGNLVVDTSAIAEVTP